MVTKKIAEERAPQIIEFNLVPGDEGKLFFADLNSQLPFAVKRVYYILDVPENVSRGAHAHKRLDQLVIAMTGSFIIDITNGVNEWTYELNNPGQALYLPSGVWRTLRNFSRSAVCLVLASECYEADDYIRDYEQFVAWKSKREDD